MFCSQLFVTLHLDMKQLPILMIAGVAAMLMASCKEKKPETKDYVIADYEIPTPNPIPEAMNSTAEGQYVEWMDGRVYNVKLMRTAVDSLPRVADKNGQTYKDNAVKLTITRSDSSVFFNRTFTKAAFTQLLDNDYRKNAMLREIRFVEIEGLNMVFAATLNYPEDYPDEAIDLRLSVSSQGHINIDRFPDNMRDDQRLLNNEP